MCHDRDARPPVPPVAGAAGQSHGRAIVLTAADGNRLSAFAATAETPGGPGVVILPDVRGLHPFYRELAIRFADAEVHATAIDYFGRTAGTGARDDRFDYAPHIDKTAPGTVAADVGAAVAFARTAEGGAANSVFTVGFCFGGTNSFNQAAKGHGLAGVIGFYGKVRDPGD